jgi:hypothetical protein
MKLKLCVLTALLGVVICANAQINLDLRIKKERVVKGIIVKDGKETEGYIKKVTETRSDDGVRYNAFDNFQDAITFIPKDIFENTEKLKANMFVKYKPEDIDGYIYIYENGDVLVYESVKYSDTSGGLGLKMIPKKTFLRLESKGKMSIYVYFIAPPPVLSDAKYHYEAAEVPNIVYRLATETDASPKALEYLIVEKDLSDCPQVVEKYKNGEYNVVGKKGTESKFMKFVNKAAANDKMKEAALFDYNELCSSEDSAE